MLRVLKLFFVVATGMQATMLSPFSLDFSASGGASALQGTVVSTGLNFAYGIARLPDGSIVFGQSTPTSSAGLYYGNGPATTGSVWIQAKLPGGDFAAPQKIVDGLAGVVTDVRTFGDGTILVDSGAGKLNTRKLSYFTSTGQTKGTMDFNFPGSWEHSTGMSLVQQNVDGTANVFFNIGSRGDNLKTTDTVTLSGLGLVSATLNPDSVYRITVNTVGASVQVVGAPTQVATGFRNAYGLDLDQSGNLLVGDNGIDGAHVHDELGADALFRISAASIGNLVFDGGFPDSYTDFATGQYVNGDPNATAPLVAFRPALNSQGNPQSSEGIAGLAFVRPGHLGTGIAGGVLATFHGVFDAGGSDNYDNSLALYDLATGRLTPILDAGASGVGHIDSVLIEGNSIFLSDFSRNGQVNSLQGLGQGAIYEFDYPVSTPEPRTWFGVAAALGLLMARRLKTASAHR
jgi:hypothetical protein